MLEGILNRIRKIFINKEYKLNSNIVWIGNSYGGFFVNPDMLNSSSVVLSFGIGEDMSFDIGLYSLGVRKIHLFDPTPKSIAFVKDSNIPKGIKFFNYGILDDDQYQKFYLPKNDDFVSASVIRHTNVKDNFVNVEFKKLSTIMKELNIRDIDLLKMDIEGSEFEVLQNILDSEIYPSQICVEYHPRFFGNGDKLLKDSIENLLRNGYTIGGVSRSGDEYLFIKN